MCNFFAFLTFANIYLFNIINDLFGNIKLINKINMNLYLYYFIIVFHLTS